MTFPKFLPSGFSSSSVLHVAALAIVWQVASQTLFMQPPQQGKTSLELQATMASSEHVIVTTPIEIESPNQVTEPVDQTTPQQPNKNLVTEKQDPALTIIKPNVSSYEPQLTLEVSYLNQVHRVESLEESDSVDSLPQPVKKKQQTTETPKLVASQVSIPSPSSVKDSGVSQAVPIQVSFSVAPIYPPVLLSQGVERSDRIELFVLVNSEGKVEQVRIAKSSGIAEIDRSAASAAKQWKFEPATDQPIAKKQWVKLKFRYRAEK